MSIAVMQPYLFPYIGYFQLIQAVDTFVFYDDVNFIKGGWIHRNRLLIQNTPLYFTVPLENASSFTAINQVNIHKSLYPVWKKKLYKTIEQNYARAPYFKDVLPLVKRVFDADQTSISMLAISSIKEVALFLGLEVLFEESSKNYQDSFGLDRVKRLQAICKKTNQTTYINLAGGKELYTKEVFLKEDITLKFISNQIKAYLQNTETFISGLSILDVLMFQSKQEVIEQLHNYTFLKS